MATVLPPSEDFSRIPTPRPTSHHVVTSVIGRTGLQVIRGDTCTVTSENINYMFNGISWIPLEARHESIRDTMTYGVLSLDEMHQLRDLQAGDIAIVEGSDTRYRHNGSEWLALRNDRQEFQVNGSPYWYSQREAEALRDFEQHRSIRNQATNRAIATTVANTVRQYPVTPDEAFPPSNGGIMEQIRAQEANTSTYPELTRESLEEAIRDLTPPMPPVGAQGLQDFDNAMQNAFDGTPDPLVSREGIITPEDQAHAKAIIAERAIENEEPLQFLNNII